MNDQNAFWLSITTLGFLLTTVAFGLLFEKSDRTINNMKKEAIERGFAHYNSTSGNWEWNESLKVEETK